MPTPANEKYVRWAASAVLFLAMAAVFWPVALGGRSGTILVSGVSMEPTMHTGDLALLRSEPAYEVGDIVAFRVPAGEQGAGAIVIHRIVGGSAKQGYVLQGDNKDRPDPWRPKPGDVIGSRWGLAPRAGTVLAWLLAPLHLAALAAGITVFAIVVKAPKPATKVELGLEPSA